MINIVFRNLPASEIAREIVKERITEALSKFPDLSRHKVFVVLSMYNSPVKRGPDLFGIRLRMTGKKVKEVVLEKKATNLYIAAAELRESLLERLNRRLDKLRIKSVKEARKLKIKQQTVYAKNESFNETQDGDNEAA